jgi:YggT family protein
MHEELVLQGARILVALCCLASAVIALTQAAVRSRRLNPFGAFPRFIRRISDPVVKPLERRIVRSGGNPQNAPWWLFWITAIGGLVILGLLQWALGAVNTLGAVVHAGPRGMLRYLVDSLFGLLMACLLIRVVASWLGLSPYAKWMRPCVWLTEWLLEPLRRVLPPLGMFDISPMVAWLLLMLARWFVVGLL